MIMPIPHADGNTDTYNEKTEVVYGINNTTVTILQFLYNSILELNICVDRVWPIIIYKYTFLKKRFLILKVEVLNLELLQKLLVTIYYTVGN